MSVTMKKTMMNMQYPEGAHYKRSVAALVLAGLLLLSVRAAAQEGEEYRLSVQPSICVSYNSEEPCTMAVEVRWEGRPPADICLRDALLIPMLQCWEDSARGNVALEYASTVDGLYQLVTEASLGVLAEAEVKVINRDLRSSRKRRRHVWSIL